MSAPLVLAVAAPLRLTLWVVAVATALVVAVIAIGISRHLQWVRTARRREHVRGELEPVYARFLDSNDAARLAEELRPAILRMDATHRPVAAVVIMELMRQAASSAQTEALRQTLEHAGIVGLAHQGTRRRSPWRRALACELLGKIGSPRSVPVLLERAADRRPEVRIAAVRALAEIGSTAALPALSKAFLTGTFAPTNCLAAALRAIGGDAAPAFERGIESPDPIIRISSCFGLSAVARERSAATSRLGLVLASDPDARVRAAAAAALGMLGGGEAPAALVRASDDPHENVRRSAVRALGSFDDPDSCETLDERTEDEDRETALRAAEALLKRTGRPRAAAHARARLEASSAWAVAYVRAVAEVSA